MLWRARATLADRPGSLAALTRHCGQRQVNILGLQFFPGVDGVTDELVLRAPRSWRREDVVALVEAAGGSAVAVDVCTEHALADGVTRYLDAATRVVRRPALLVEELSGLLDCPAAAAGDPALGGPQDVLEVEVAGEGVRLRRATPFTDTERARATAFAALVDGLVEPARPSPPTPHPAGEQRPVTVRDAGPADAAALIAMHGRCSTESVYRHFAAPLTRPDPRLARRLLTGGTGAVVATDDDDVVGFTSLSPVQEGRCEVALLVEDARQRQGIGTRLLAAAAHRAASAGAEDVVLRGPAESQAAVAMVHRSGLRARVRLSGDQLVVTISTRGLGLDQAPVGDGNAEDRRYDGPQPTPVPRRAPWTSPPPASPRSSQPSG